MAYNQQVPPNGQLYMAPMPQQPGYPVPVQQGYPTPMQPVYPVPVQQPGQAAPGPTLNAAGAGAAPAAAPAEQLSTARGPVEKRKVRDIFCLIMFILFWAAGVYFGINIGMRKPVLEKAYWPLDVNGRFCGKDAAFSETGFTFPQAQLHYNERYSGFITGNTTLLAGAGTPLPVPTAPFDERQDLNNMSSLPHLFWPIYNVLLTPSVGHNHIGINPTTMLTDISFDEAICVANCPTVAAGYNAFLNPPTGTASDLHLTELSCHKEFNYIFGAPTEYSGEDYVTRYNAASDGEKNAMKAMCRTAIYPTAESTIPGVVNRCLPDFSESLSKVDDVMLEAMGLVLDDALIKFLSQAKIVIPVICGAFGLAVLCGYIFLFGMRWTAKFFTWVLIFILMAGLGYCTYYSWMQYVDVKGVIDDLGSTNVTPWTNVQLDMWLGVAITVSVITGLYVLIIAFMAKRINFAIALVVEAGHVMTNILALWLVPIIFTVIAVLFASGILAGMFYLWASGDYYQLDGHRGFRPTGIDPYIYAYLVFAFFWSIYFFRYLMQTVVAGATAGWYWRMDKSKRVRGQVWASTMRALKYHMGSVAFAAFFSALLWWILWLLTVLDKRIKSSLSASQSKLATWVIKILKGILFIVSRIVDFLNKYAIVEIAVYGESYCQSAKRAAKLIGRNPARFLAINTVGTALLVIGRIGAALLCGSIAGVSVYYGGKAAGYAALADAFGLAAIVAGLIGLVVSDVFYDTYEVVVNSIVMCFLEDTEQNDGSPEKPYFASARMAQYIKAAKERSAPDLADKQSE